MTVESGSEQRHSRSANFFLELFRKTIFQGSYQGGKKQEICDYKMIILVLPLWKQVFFIFLLDL